MKRIICAIIFSMMPLFLCANDAYIITAGGAILPSDRKESESIRMVSESIQITLFDQHYQVEVAFRFVNEGMTDGHDVGANAGDSSR